ncbi:hypothetical protein [Variovorax saccharolyticus]|uniref:hypothetical protein n=1 Tax=Variovorax saccharolyticus TaxID=3053516 RepID=UPI0025784A6D|nr:hypothetical protein [Variovorax sp. J31P216]MDM0024121.1 hypothetical protein [Variovorax sp. J31P216]
MAKGVTRWFPRHVEPVRHGEYECRVQFSRSLPCFRWRLQWDGKGFLVPFPMIVHHWRGQTKRAAKEQPHDR